MKNLSIEENLKRIFRTKKYSIALNPNYGLSYEWVDRVFTKELELNIIAEITEQIALFEPRLKITDISITKEDSQLNIAINTDFKVSI